MSTFLLSQIIECKREESWELLRRKLLGLEKYVVSVKKDFDIDVLFN